MNPRKIFSSFQSQLSPQMDVKCNEDRFGRVEYSIAFVSSCCDCRPVSYRF